MLSRKIWSARVLVPLWVLQFILLPLVIFSIAALVMEYTADWGWAPATSVAQLTFFSLCFLILPFEITAYVYDFLHPWAFLAVQIFKSFFWTVCLVAAIYNFTIAAPIATGFWNVWKVIQLAFVLILSLTLYTALSYGAVSLHRYRSVGTQYNHLGRNTTNTSDEQ